MQPSWSGLQRILTLEELSLTMVPSDDDGAVSARNALFFRTQLHSSLTVSFSANQKESYVSAFRLEAVK
jgi:hypothetical protein